MLLYEILKKCLCPLHGNIALLWLTSLSPDFQFKCLQEEVHVELSEIVTGRKTVCTWVERVDVWAGTRDKTRHSGA